MLVFGGKGKQSNVLHVALGPESEAMLDLHGVVALDISMVLDNLNHKLPVLLYITRCRSEHLMGSNIHNQLQCGGKYPLSAPHHVFFPTDKKLDGRPVEDEDEDEDEEMPRRVPGAAAPQPTAVCCSRCRGTKDIVPKLDPPLCYSCLQIDIGLSKLSGTTAPADTVPYTFAPKRQLPQDPK